MRPHAEGGEGFWRAGADWGGDADGMLLTHGSRGARMTLPASAPSLQPSVFSAERGSPQTYSSPSLFTGDYSCHW